MRILAAKVEHYDISPGDGTRYDFVTCPDPYGGLLVIWPGHSTWRYYAGDYLKFLHGQECEYARKAIWNHLEGMLIVEEMFE